jgi:ribose transport system substrate-binding protein
VTTHTPPSWQRPLQTLPVLLGLMLQAATATATLAKPTPAPQRFVVIPKTHHPWFDAVRKGAQAAAVMIEAQTGGKASIDYRPPSKADAGQQTNILKAAIRSRPTGITIDLLDAIALRPLLKKAQQQGIAVNVFDSEPPSDLPLTSIGNDFCQQARIASERLVKLLNGQGEVAIMQGVTTAPNHAIRVRCHQQVFARHPGITVVATPIDQDSITIAEQQALATMERHPQPRHPEPEPNR